MKLATTATKAKPSNFDWDAKVWAPFNEAGWVRFNVPLAGVLVAQPLSWPRDVVEELRGFLGTFCVLAASADITPYQISILEALADVPSENLQMKITLSWPVILAGLTSLTETLDVALKGAGEGAVEIPISPMHIWAMEEAARAFVFCFDPDCEMPAYHQSAQAILALCDEQSFVVTSLCHPYGNVVTDAGEY